MAAWLRAKMGGTNSKPDPHDRRHPRYSERQQYHNYQQQQWSSGQVPNENRMGHPTYNGRGCGSVDSMEYERGPEHSQYGQGGRYYDPTHPPTCAPFKPQDEERDPFKDIQFDDEELRKEELKHKQNLRALDEDYERRMRALETVRKRKMEETFAEYSSHPNFPKKEPMFPESYNTGEFKHRGLCVIVRNSDKYEKSAALLEDIFTRLGYVVNSKKNLDERRMLTLINYASQQNFEDYGSFVSFFLGTGTDKYVETADKKTIDINTIVDFFNPKDTQGLGDKPKLFFFQSDVDILSNQSLWNGKKNGKKKYLNPVDAFVLRSTHRDFIKNFTEIAKQDNKLSLSSILDSVARHTMPLSSNKEKYEIVSTLRKEVYLGQNESQL